MKLPNPDLILGLGVVILVIAEILGAIIPGVLLFMILLVIAWKSHSDWYQKNKKKVGKNFGKFKHLNIGTRIALIFVLLIFIPIYFSDNSHGFFVLLMMLVLFLIIKILEKTRRI